MGWGGVGAVCIHTLCLRKIRNSFIDGSLIEKSLYETDRIKPAPAEAPLEIHEFRHIYNQLGHTRRTEAATDRRPAVPPENFDESLSKFTGRAVLYRGN